MESCWQNHLLLWHHCWLFLFQYYYLWDHPCVIGGWGGNHLCFAVAAKLQDTPKHKSKQADTQQENQQGSKKKKTQQKPEKSSASRKARRRREPKPDTAKQPCARPGEFPDWAGRAQASQPWLFDGTRLKMLAHSNIQFIKITKVAVQVTFEKHPSPKKNKVWNAMVLVVVIIKQRPSWTWSSTGC